MLEVRLKKTFIDFYLNNYDTNNQNQEIQVVKIATPEYFLVIRTLVCVFIEYFQTAIFILYPYRVQDFVK